jgi:hypothetical protein
MGLTKNLCLRLVSGTKLAGDCTTLRTSLGLDTPGKVGSRVDNIHEVCNTVDKRNGKGDKRNAYNTDDSRNGTGSRPFQQLQHLASGRPV